MGCTAALPIDPLGRLDDCLAGDRLEGKWLNCLHSHCWNVNSPPKLVLSARGVKETEFSFNVYDLHIYIKYQKPHHNSVFTCQISVFYVAIVLCVVKKNVRELQPFIYQRSRR